MPELLPPKACTTCEHRLKMLIGNCNQPMIQENICESVLSEMISGWPRAKQWIHAAYPLKPQGTEVWKKGGYVHTHCFDCGKKYCQKDHHCIETEKAHLKYISELRRIWFALAELPDDLVAWEKHKEKSLIKTVRLRRKLACLIEDKEILKTEIDNLVMEHAKDRRRVHIEELNHKIRNTKGRLRRAETKYAESIDMVIAKRLEYKEEIDTAAGSTTTVWKMME